jgi:hypothetical protein
VDSEPFDELRAHLSRWDRRRRLRDMLLWAPRGVLAGLLITALLATIARLRPLLDNDEVALVGVMLALAGLLAALIAIWLSRRSVMAQARFADAALRLQERASTAVELAQGSLSAPPALSHAQLDDALHKARRVDMRAGLPLVLLGRDWLLLVAAAVLVGAAVILPNPQGELLSAQRALEAEIEEQAEHLQALADEIEQNEALSEEQREELQQPLADALAELEQGDLTREEAVAALSEAEAELRDLQASNDTSALQRTLNEAAQPLSESGAGQQLGSSLQSGNLSAASAQAGALADSLPELTPEEQAALADALSEAAAQLQEIDPELASEMAAAAQALSAGDVAAAQEALRQAAGTLQQRTQQQAAAQQAGSAAGQLAQGRQQVAQAGEPGQREGGQPGEGGAGEGEGAGGEGSGSGSGSGDGGGQGSGSGSSDSGTGVGGGIGGTGGETGRAANVYVPDFADLSDVAGEDVELPAECIANPSACGALLNERPTAFGDESSSVPYQQVFGDYRDAAYEALEEEYIPLGMKGYIRDYFSSLEP